MSIFKVGIEQIATIVNHPDADRLEIASLEGMAFQFVVLKGKHKPGDRVVYFPLDSIVPAKCIEVMGLTGKLGGDDRNIVCSVRLRGFVSQGLVEFPNVLANAGLMPRTNDDRQWEVGDDVTAILGAKKHIEPPVDIPGAILHDLPSVLSVYDIEGADRFAVVAERLMDQLVLITEKLEGSNYGAHLEDNSFGVLQHERMIVEKPGFTVKECELARRLCLAEKAEIVRTRFPNDQITLTGELVGPGCQAGNHYKLSEITAYFFDIQRNGQFIDADVQDDLFSTITLPTVPVIAKGVTLRDWLAGRTIKDASHGQSLLNPQVLREGIVIRPMKEMRDPRIGRLILKQRDPIYLAKHRR